MRSPIEKIVQALTRALFWIGVLIGVLAWWLGSWLGVAYLINNTIGYDIPLMGTISLLIWITINVFLYFTWKLIERFFKSFRKASLDKVD